jgi:hypothetical protein
MLGFGKATCGKSSQLSIACRIVDQSYLELPPLFFLDFRNG